jgi:PII interaction protein X
MSVENYLNHPNFGLLYRLCETHDGRELFSTLYAQRLFFMASGRGPTLQFEAVSRTDARLALENRLRILRRDGNVEAFNILQTTYKQTF